MSTHERIRSLTPMWVAAAATAFVVCICTPAAGGARGADASTGATIHASFLPDRLGANTALTLALRFAGSPGEIPTPLRSIVLHLPAGLGVGLGGSSSCAPTRLRQRGTGGCPPSSLLGRGHAQLEVHAGSQTIPEQAALWVVHGPSRGSTQTLMVLGVGSTPLHERIISTALLHRDSAPYGTKLAISIPPIPTLVYEPDGSVDSMTMTVGGLTGDPRARTAAARILVPRHCPAGGFPFAADITFSDRSTARATTVVPCP